MGKDNDARIAAITLLSATDPLTFVENWKFVLAYSPLLDTLTLNEAVAHAAHAVSAKQAIKLADRTQLKSETKLSVIEAFLEMQGKKGI